eukprot:scaffold80680_cov36-Tisochrysis_lutea.AAC.1
MGLPAKVVRWSAVPRSVTAPLPLFLAPQACQEAIMRQDLQQAVATDDLCAALMDEYVEWLAAIGKEALPEAKGIEWATKAEEHRQLKVARTLTYRFSAWHT